MLRAQLLGSGFNGLGDATGVRALQTTLRAIGDTSISVSGSVDGPTAAAVYKLIRDKGGQLPGLPSDIKSAFDKVKSFDSMLNTYTFGKFDSTSLLRYSSTVISAVRAVNTTAANTMQTGVNAMFTAIDRTVVGLNVAFKILMPVPPASTPPTTVTLPTSKIAFLHAMDLSLMNRAVLKTAEPLIAPPPPPPPTIPAQSALPLGLTKGRLIVLVLVALGVGAVIMKKRAA